MRLLAAIPHYYRRTAEPAHGSLGASPESRAAALASAISALHQLFGEGHCQIDIATRTARPANAATAGEVTVAICTTGDDHLLHRLDLPRGAYHHQQTSALPPLLGFECHLALRSGLGSFDYYAYLEDDLTCRDPWFLAKLAWFNEHLGDHLLLQPNRYEVARTALVPKAYLDGDLAEPVTRPFQDRGGEPILSSSFLNRPITFHRASNPHSGCFFLNARQLDAWAARDDFCDRDTRFIGPLESAATLGIMRAFRIYKPAPENAAFLEIEHAGTAFIDQLRLAPPTPAASQPPKINY